MADDGRYLSIIASTREMNPAMLEALRDQSVNKIEASSVSANPLGITTTLQSRKLRS